MMKCSIHTDLFKDTVMKRCGHMFSEKAVQVSTEFLCMLHGVWRVVTMVTMVSACNAVEASYIVPLPFTKTLHASR
jgi:hypothetical protein